MKTVKERSDSISHKTNNATKNNQQMSLPNLCSILGNQTMLNIINQEKNDTDKVKPNDTISLLQQAFFSGQLGKATSLVEKNLNSGRPLPTKILTKMNRHYDYDFSQVRIHTDGFAARAATAIDSNAFTIGNNIAFAPGMFAPETESGYLRLTHELAHTIQQTGSSPNQSNHLEGQASLAGLLGGLYAKKMDRIAPVIQREPTYPRRATGDQIIREASRILALARSPSSLNDTERMWSNVDSNFTTDITTGSIARRIWTYIFLRHFNEPSSPTPYGDMESIHPRYFYSNTYGWIDAQHFFGFVDFAESCYLANPGNQTAAFQAATDQGRKIEENQQTIRNIFPVMERQRSGLERDLRVEIPNTPLFRLPAATLSGAALHSFNLSAAFLLQGTQKELFNQLNQQQQYKFYKDAAKSAFTYEDFVSNQLGTKFFFTHGVSINNSPVVDRERLFISALSTFFASINVENSQSIVNQLARSLPLIERLDAPKTTEEIEKKKHPELFKL